MKVITSILFLIILPYTNAMGTQQTLLKCLGQQEEILHKYKISNQTVSFHQQFISDALNFQKMRIKKTYLNEICKYKTGLKSFLFLKIFLRQKGQVFQRRLSSKKRNELYEKILIHIQNYISLTQNSSPNTECLFIDHPAVSKFLFQVLYLRNTQSAQQILDKNKLGLKVLSELEKFPSRAQRCSKAK